MDSRSLALIEDTWGGLDGLVEALLTDEAASVALDESEPLVLRAQAANLPLKAFAQAIKSREFMTLLRAGLVRREFNLRTEAEHIHQVVKVAKGDRKLVMSARGTFGEVDQAAGDVIAAGKYLNELRGTPVERNPQAVGLSFNINIENALVRVDVEHDSASVGEIDSHHTARRAGDLPPPGVLSRTGAPVRERFGDGSQSLDQELGVIYSSDSEQAAYDLEVARRTQAYRERHQADKGTIDLEEFELEKSLTE